MVKILLICFFLSFCGLSFAVEAGAKNFCQQTSHLEALSDESNHLFFKNSGGLLNSGVCWWHSRFTRNALYLVQWRPDLAKPSIKQAKKIIRKIRRGLGVVVVPGFANLNSFSQAHESLIRSELENWQIMDGVFKNKWIDGLSGTPSMPAKLLSEYMDFLYHTVNRTQEVLFLRVQLQGVSAHAWLLKSMTKTEDGYRFEVVDSNFHGIKTFDYIRGSTSMRYFYTDFIPYLQFTPELIKIKSIAKSLCRKLN